MRKIHGVVTDQRHCSEADKRKPEQCPICGMPYLFLLQHIRKKHPDQAGEHMVCSSYETKRNKNYQCDDCGLMLKGEQSYREHMTIHTNTFLYLCEYCGKPFRRSSNLRTHLFTHTGERPYKCPECGKGFMTPEDCGRHIRTHTGEKPFVCKLCDRAYSQKGALDAHVKKKHYMGVHE